MVALLAMIHALVASAETYLKHDSISKYKGFTLAINGIKVYKVLLWF
jgi:hypothetical protein